MDISISHTTRYRFDMAPAHGLQRLRLKPETGATQTVLDWDMTVEGADIQVLYDDHNDNGTALVSFAPGTREIVVTCTGLVRTSDDGSGVTGPHDGYLPLWAFVNHTDLTRPGPRLQALADDLATCAATPLERLHRLSRAIHAAVRFAAGQTDARTTAEAALAAGQGVCQDHAHIFIAVARLLDVPARYVSGYLLIDNQVDQQAGHGWAEAHVDELGWVGFDVANGVSPDARYVRVASGLDYHDAAPVTGLSHGLGNSELSVRLSVAGQPGARQVQAQ